MSPLNKHFFRTLSRIGGRSMSHDMPMAQQTPLAANKLPLLSATDFRKYNQLAEHMEYFVKT